MRRVGKQAVVVLAAVDMLLVERLGRETPRPLHQVKVITALPVKEMVSLAVAVVVQVLRQLLLMVATVRHRPSLALASHALVAVAVAGRVVPAGQVAVAAAQLREQQQMEHLTQVAVEAAQVRYLHPEQGAVAVAA